MSELRDHLAALWTVVPGAPAVPPERFARYRDVLPPSLHELWREFGFCGFGDGKWWLTDPDEWAPVVEAWTPLLDEVTDGDTCHVYARTAFGVLYLCGERVGPVVTVEPPALQAMAFEAPAEPVTPDQQLWDAISDEIEADEFNMDDEDDEPLFDRALAELGPVSADTMYALAPHPALGGAVLLKHLIIEQAIPHLGLLSGFGDPGPMTTMGGGSFGPVLRTINLQ